MVRVLLIHWNAEEAAELAAPLRAAGVEVGIEAQDGGAAVKRIVADPPDQVLISLERLPSHGRTVAQHLAGRKSTTQVPILFFGGAPEAVAKALQAAPSARHVPLPELTPAVLPA
jgi:DNA-binding response OmpR family regulator